MAGWNERWNREKPCGDSGFDRLYQGLPHLGKCAIDRFFLIENVDIAGGAGGMFDSSFTDVGQGFLGSIFIRFVLVVGGNIGIKLC